MTSQITKATIVGLIGWSLCACNPKPASVALGEVTLQFRSDYQRLWDVFDYTPEMALRAIYPPSPYDAAGVNAELKSAVHVGADGQSRYGPDFKLSLDFLRTFLSSGEFCGAMLVRNLSLKRADTGQVVYQHILAQIPLELRRIHNTLNADYGDGKLVLPTHTEGRLQLADGEYLLSLELYSPEACGVTETTKSVTHFVSVRRPIKDGA